MGGKQNGLTSTHKGAVSQAVERKKLEIGDLCEHQLRYQLQAQTLAF